LIRYICARARAQSICSTRAKVSKFDHDEPAGGESAKRAQ